MMWLDWRDIDVLGFYAVLYCLSGQLILILSASTWQGWPSVFISVVQPWWQNEGYTSSFQPTSNFSRNCVWYLCPFSCQFMQDTHNQTSVKWCCSFSDLSWKLSAPNKELGWGGGLKATWNVSRKSSWTAAFLVSLGCVDDMTSGY